MDELAKDLLVLSRINIYVNCIDRSISIATDIYIYIYIYIRRLLALKFRHATDISARMVQSILYDGQRFFPQVKQETNKYVEGSRSKSMQQVTERIYIYIYIEGFGGLVVTATAPYHGH